MKTFWDLSILRFIEVLECSLEYVNLRNDFVNETAVNLISNLQGVDQLLDIVVRVLEVIPCNHLSFFGNGLIQISNDCRFRCTNL